MAKSGTLIHDCVDGRALAGNPLGDPTERDLFVYHPAAANGRRRFPAVVVIVGFTGIGENPFQRSFFGEALHERLDRLIASGKVPPMVVAVPDTVTALGGSQYVDSKAVGRYETFVVRDVVRHLDALHPTKPAARHRGICGKSSGGIGALRLGMRHADIFGALASHSGDAYFDYCYRLDFPTAWNEIRRAGSVAKWLRAFRRKPKPGSHDVHTLNIIAMSACYSPDENEPAGFALPFHMDTGAERPEVMRRWRKFDPVVMVGRYAAKLRKMRGIFIDCGLRDEWALHIGARVLSKRMNELRIKHVHEEFDDGHRGISYRYDASFPHLGKWLS